jgi:hypothetical protein
MVNNMQSLRSFFNKTFDEGSVQCRLCKKPVKAAKGELMAQKLIYCIVLVLLVYYYLQ